MDQHEADLTRQHTDLIWQSMQDQPYLDRQDSLTTAHDPTPQPAAPTCPHSGTPPQ